MKLFVFLLQITHRFALRSYFYAASLCCLLLPELCRSQSGDTAVTDVSSIAISPFGGHLAVSNLNARPISPTITANAQYGFFIANQPKSLYLRDDHAKFIELAVSLQTNGNRRWHAESAFPAGGIALLFGDLGSEKYLGKLAALYPYLDFPLLRTRRSITSFRLGAGLGWVEKPYNKETNYKNLMISTHFNAVMAMNLQTEWGLSGSTWIHGGVSFTHLSNGSARLPNLGLNIPALMIGVKKSIGSNNDYDQEKFRELYHISRVRWKDSVANRTHHGKSGRRKPTVIWIQASGALKQTYPLESKLKLVQLVNVEFQKQMGPVSKALAGLQVSYDGSLSKEIANTPDYVFENKELKLQASLYLGYEHVAGRLSVPVQLGVYVYNKYLVNQLFQVVGLRYQFTDKLNAGVYLKAHFGKADYIFYGIGYKIF